MPCFMILLKSVEGDSACNQHGAGSKPKLKRATREPGNGAAGSTPFPSRVRVTRVAALPGPSSPPEGRQDWLAPVTPLPQWDDMPLNPAMASQRPKKRTGQSSSSIGARLCSVFPALQEEGNIARPLAWDPADSSQAPYARRWSLFSTLLKAAPHQTNI